MCCSWPPKLNISTMKVTIQYELQVWLFILGIDTAICLPTSLLSSCRWSITLHVPHSFLASLCRKRCTKAWDNPGTSQPSSPHVSARAGTHSLSVCPQGQGAASWYLAALGGFPLIQHPLGCPGPSALWPWLTVSHHPSPLTFLSLLPPPQRASRPAFRGDGRVWKLSLTPRWRDSGGRGNGRQGRRRR